MMTQGSKEDLKFSDLELIFKDLKPFEQEIYYKPVH